MVLGAALLVIKGAGFAAEAQEQQQQAAAPAPEQIAQNADPAADDPDSSSAQVDVLTSLAKRRSELDARERDLEMRDNLIAAAEKRVEGKIDNLKQLQSQIQALLVQRDAADQKQLDSLVKTYSSMKPKDAARIFDNLTDEVLVPVAGQMKPDVLGAILAAMQPDAAQKLTVKLADRLKLPEVPAQAAPAQLASALPAALPATPTAQPTAPVASAPQPPAATPQAAAATPVASAPPAGKAASPAPQASSAGK